MEKAYETYKDSGVEWIGKIPENWKSVSLKWISNITKGRKPKVDYDESGENLLPYLSMEFLRDKTSNPTYASIDEKGLVFVDDGDILILWDGSKAGEIVKAKKGALSSTMAKIDITDSDFESTYLNYLLQLGEKHIQENTIGMGIPHVSGDVLKGLKMLLPPKQEQTQIAAYLDYHTQLIDTLISKKETLIQKLQEQRQAIINEAVTKGLNKNVVLKDSGIEWLGEIPEHWEITSIKNILDIPITDGPHTTPKLYDEGIPFISAESIRNNEIDFNRKRGYISEEDYELFSKKYLPKINDIYMVKSGATTGNIGIVKTEEKFTIWSPLAVFRAKSEKVFYEYLFYYLQSSLFKYQVELNWSYGTQQNIGMGVLSNLKISYPSVVEQQNIVSFIKNSALKIVINIEKIQTSIQKLKEYRQSLISEAVTGKIDVRDWQEPDN